MIEIGIATLVGIAIGFVAGVLVYRNNVKLLEQKIADVEAEFDTFVGMADSASERLNEELQAAYAELEQAKAKLTRKKS